MRKTFHLAILAVGLLICAGCTGPAYEYHYKLSIDADVDGKPVQASSVVAVGLAYKLYWSFGYPMTGVESGEAIVFLSSRGALAIPLRHPDPLPPEVAAFLRGYPTEILRELCKIKREHWSDKDGANKAIERLVKCRGKQQLPLDFLPHLVVFSDPTDSRTATRVAPSELSRVMGSSIVLRSATIEVTDEYVTHGIERKLPLIESLLGDSAYDYKFRLVSRNSWFRWLSFRLRLG